MALPSLGRLPMCTTSIWPRSLGTSRTVCSISGHRYSSARVGGGVTVVDRHAALGDPVA